MIWLSSFSTFFPFSLKYFFFFSSFFFLDSNVIFMASICLITLILIYSFFFPVLTSLDSKIYLFMFMFMVVMIMLCFSCYSPFFFLFFLECSVFPISILIMIFSKDFDKVSSLFFMFLINMVGSIPFMLFSSFVFSLINFGSSFANLMVNSLFIFFSFTLILLSKVPFFFLHVWLTKAHVSASGSCSMILASLMLKLGTFGLFKFSSYFFFFFYNIFFFFISISFFCCFFFIFVMVRFFDMKYMVACSSIFHMAFIFPFLIYFSNFAVLSSLFMMVGHGVISLFLFYLVTLCYEISGSRSIDFNKSLESIMKPFFISYLLFMFLNLGLPPFMSFMTEFLYMCLFLNLSFYSVFFFSLAMLGSIFFTMFMFSNFIFFKSVFFSSKDLNYSLNFFTFSFLIYFFFLPFLF